MSEEANFTRGFAAGSANGIAQGYQNGFDRGWERRSINGNRAGIAPAASRLPPYDNLDYQRGWRGGFGAEYGRSFDQGHRAGYGAAALPVVHPAVVPGLQPASAPALTLARMASSPGSSSTARDHYSPFSTDHAPLPETRYSPPHHAPLPRDDIDREPSPNRGRHASSTRRRSRSPYPDFSMYRPSRTDGSRENERPYRISETHWRDRSRLGQAADSFNSNRCHGRSQSPATTHGRGQSDYGIREARESGAAQEHQSGRQEEEDERYSIRQLRRYIRRYHRGLPLHSDINGSGAADEDSVDGSELSSLMWESHNIEGLIDEEHPTVYTRRTADITNSTDPTSDWFNHQRPFALHQGFPQTLQLTPTISGDSEGGHIKCAICLCEFLGREGDCTEPVIVRTTGCACRVVVGLPCLRSLFSRANSPSCLICRRDLEIYDEPLEVRDEDEIDDRHTPIRVLNHPSEVHDQDENDDRHTPIRVSGRPSQIDDQDEIDDRHTPIHASNQPLRLLDQDENDNHNDNGASDNGRIHSNHIDQQDRDDREDLDDPNDRIAD